MKISVDVRGLDDFKKKLSQIPENLHHAHYGNHQ